MKKGFPLTTVILVVLGTLMMVSRQVTPPPKLPDPVKPASMAEAKHEHKDEIEAHEKHDGEETKEYYAKMMQEQKQKAELQAKAEAEKKAQEEKARKEIQGRKSIAKSAEDATPRHRFDPNNSTIDNTYFNAVEMGEKGIKQTDEAVAEARAIELRVLELQKAKDKEAQKGGDKAK
jgi:hypothetical protein